VPSPYHNLGTLPALLSSSSLFFFFFSFSLLPFLYLLHQQSVAIMGRRQVNLDDEATIKAFLARLDMLKKSSQTSSTLAIPSSPHKDLPVSDENVIPSTPVQIEHSFSKVIAKVIVFG